MAIPCPSVDGRIGNIYGRSIAGAPAHRFLPRPKAGLFAWHAIGHLRSVILVEGLFDLIVLWGGCLGGSDFRRRLAEFQQALLLELLLDAQVGNGPQLGEAENRQS